MSSQAKRFTYAAATQFFVQTGSILTAFHKNLRKKFDIENSTGLAFDSDEKLSVSERILERSHQAFDEVEQGEFTLLKEQKDAADSLRNQR